MVTIEVINLKKIIIWTTENKGLCVSIESETDGSVLTGVLSKKQAETLAAVLSVMAKQLD